MCLLQMDLQNAQRANQDVINRNNILSSQTAALQEQLLLAGDREKEQRKVQIQKEEENRQLGVKLQMMNDVKNNW